MWGMDPRPSGCIYIVEQLLLDHFVFLPGSLFFIGGFFLDVFFCQCPLEFLSFFSFQFKTKERKHQVTSHCVHLLTHPPSFTVFCSYFNRIPRVLSYSDVGEIERITLAPPFWSSGPFILWVVTEAFSQTPLPSTPNYRFVSTWEPMLYYLCASHPESKNTYQSNKSGTKQ